MGQTLENECCLFQPVEEEIVRAFHTRWNLKDIKE